MSQLANIPAGTSATAVDRWMALADGAEPVLDVHPDNPRARATGTDTRTVSFDLSLSLSAEGAAGPENTGHTALLAAWALLLHRHSGVADVMIGVTNVPKSRTFSLARFQFPANTTADQVTELASEALADSRSVGEVDLPGFLRAMGADPATTNQHPVFQAALAFCDSEAELLTPVSWTEQFAPCDLVLKAWVPSSGSPKLALQYRTALFNPRRIERMALGLGNLVSAIQQNATAECGAYQIVEADERSEIAGWNNTSTTAEIPTAISLFEAVAATAPTDPALEFDGTFMSYGELDQKATDLASVLKAHGIGPNKLVAISVERSHAMIVSLLAVLKTGGAYVPIDPGYPADRRNFMLEDSSATVMLTGPDAEGNAIVELRNPSVASTPQSLSKAYEEAPVGYVIYTSGSTGRPKGVELTRRALDNLIHWQLGRPNFERKQRTLQFTSLSFDVSFQEIISTLCSGGTLVLISDVERRDPMMFLERVASQNIGRLFLPFVALRGLAQASASASKIPASLREVYTAGEQLHIDDCVRSFFAALPNCLLENQYGPSESHVVTAYRLAGPASDWPVLPPIGTPIQNSQILVLNDNHQLQPVGVVGDLYIGGACLAHGYRNREDLTKERFQEFAVEGFGTQMWYRSGDLARWTYDGSIEFLGRSDNQIKFRGYRIELGEVSATISNHPRVGQCVATVREVEGFGPKLIAFITAPTDVSLVDVRKFAQEHLPDYMVPSHFEVVSSFKLTPSGKIDVESLPTPEFDRDVLGTAYVEPGNFPELRLQRIWRALLGIQDIGTHDDFFILGGNSLMAVEMFAMIRTEFNADLPLGALAADPTIAGLAAKLASANENWEVVVPINRGGAKTPVFCVHGGYGNVASFPLLARGLPSDQPFYGLQWDGLDGTKGTRAIVDMARLYVSEIKKVQPSGPYILAGQCAGAIIGREMTRILQENGETVEQMILFDAPRLEGPNFEPEKLSDVVKEKVGSPTAILRNLRFMAFALRAEIESRVARVRPENRPMHTSIVMIRALKRFKLRDVSVPTLYVSSRAKDPAKLGFSGRWTDDALGWSTFESPTFKIFPVTWDHTEIMYEPPTIKAVTEALESAHQRIAQKER